MGPDYEELSKDEKRLNKVLELFDKLNNGKFIFKNTDPNHSKWFSLNEAFNYLEEKEVIDAELKVKMERPLRVFDWNEMTMDQYVDHLNNKFQFSSSGTAKAVCELIRFYESHKDTKNQDMELLTTFLQDLIYCSADSDGNISIIEDADFYTNAFIESTNYEELKNKDEPKNNS